MRLSRIAYFRRASARAALGLAGAAFVAACNTQPGANDVGGRILRGTAQPAKQVDTADLVAHPPCPRIDIRTGTQSVDVYERGMEGDPQGLRFQAQIDKTARECFFSGGVLTMKVGVAGRLLSGPKGLGGSFSTPLRIAVVKVGDPDQVLYSQVRPLSASFSAGATAFDFSEVDDNVNIPQQGPGETYRVYVGFDAQGKTK